MTFELTILGSSSAIPTSERYLTAQVLNALERFFLIDCGEGTQIRLRQMKFSFDRIRHIFISHLHGDHFYGLPGFISTRNLMGIKTDLHIYSHSDLIKMLDPLLEHLKEDLPFKLVFHPLNFKKFDQIFSDEKIEVFSFPLNHRIPCCGFLFREKQQIPNLIRQKIEEYRIPVRQLRAIKEGADYEDENGRIIPHAELTYPPVKPRSYAFCTDTTCLDAVAGIVSEVDLLYHEATFLHRDENLAGLTFHSTARQAATLALKANVKKLILGHFSTRYKKTDPFLEEAKAVFENTELASDGTRFTIPLQKSACQS
jgi:ribonuclease Z